MNLPEAFIEQLRGFLPGEWQELAQAITATRPSVAVRVNGEKGAVVPAGARRVPWCGQGFYLSYRPTFTFDTDWHAGRYYAQDASSMFIGHVIRNLVHSPVRYLDLCAAPGGKTTAALQALPAGSLVVANEVVLHRARVLADNIVRWGNPRCVVTSNAPAHIGELAHYFDVIAADVPCSGEGMMRKDDEAVSQWSPALVEQCARRQREILSGVWNALRPGGLLIYSTCTYNRRENEEIAEFIVRELGADSLPVPVEPSWNICPALDSDIHAYRFLPHRVDGEGLFMAVFCKHGNAPRQDLRVKAAKKRGGAAQPQRANWLGDGFVLDLPQDVMGTTTAIPANSYNDLMALRAALSVLVAGVDVVKGKKAEPQHALAMLGARSLPYPICEVDYGTALRYLRGESIGVDAPRGYVCIAHRDAVLGFANNLDNRANNLYPKPLRIHSTHLPTVKPTIL